MGSSRLRVNPNYLGGWVRSTFWLDTISKNVPHISHLLFADNNLLFCRANMGDLQTIQGFHLCIKKLQANKSTDKTTFFFIKSIFEATKNSTKDLLGVF